MIHVTWPACLFLHSQTAGKGGSNLGTWVWAGGPTLSTQPPSPPLSFMASHLSCSSWVSWNPSQHSALGRFYQLDETYFPILMPLWARGCFQGTGELPQSDCPRPLHWVLPAGLGQLSFLQEALEELNFPASHH